MRRMTRWNDRLCSDHPIQAMAHASTAHRVQVLISYGQKSNAELILLYGFVVDRNLFDEVCVLADLEHIALSGTPLPC